MTTETETKLTPAEKRAEQGARRTVRLAAKKKLLEDVVRLRDQEQATWAEIVDETGASLNKVMQLHRDFHVEKVATPHDPVELGWAIAYARKVNFDSWGKIMAKFGVSEYTARKLFEQVTGESATGTSSGKGGRYPDGVTPPKSPKARRQQAFAERDLFLLNNAERFVDYGSVTAAHEVDTTVDIEEDIPAPEIEEARAATEVADPVEETPEGPEPTEIEDMNAMQLQTHLLGKTLTVTANGKVLKALVAEVEVHYDPDYEMGVAIVITGSKGGKATIGLEDIIDVQD